MVKKLISLAVFFGLLIVLGLFIFIRARGSNKRRIDEYRDGY